MSPAEFWSLTPAEVWWLVEANRPVRMYGSMTEMEVEELYRKTYGD